MLHEACECFGDAEEEYHRSLSEPDPSSFRPCVMVAADLRESGCERGGRAAILVQYDCIFIEIALLSAKSQYRVK